MIGYVVSLIASVSPLWSYVLDYVFALAFVATVPCVIRGVFR